MLGPLTPGMRKPVGMEDLAVVWLRVLSFGPQPTPLRTETFTRRPRTFLQKARFTSTSPDRARAGWPTPRFAAIAVADAWLAPPLPTAPWRSVRAAARSDHWPGRPGSRETAARP